MFPANTMEAWVTDWGAEQSPTEFRFHVSMAGTLGIGGHLLRWNEADRMIAREQINVYKQIRHIVQLGDQYRLGSAQTQPVSAVQYVSKDRSEAVLFAFRTHIARLEQPVTLSLQGLDPDAPYRVEGIEEVRSGRAWARVGVQLSLKDFSSTVRRITRVDAPVSDS